MLAPDVSPGYFRKEEPSPIGTAQLMQRVPVTMRLGAAPLHWLRQQRGYQTRINAILRGYMQAHESV